MDQKDECIEVHRKVHLCTVIWFSVRQLGRSRRTTLPFHSRPFFIQIRAECGIKFAREGGMVSFWDRVRLSMSYGKVLLICGALFNVVCAYFLATSFVFAGIMDSLVLKVLYTTVELYLMRQFEHRDAVFFYINLGLTRRMMLATVLALDFLVWAVLMIIIVFAR